MNRRQTKISGHRPKRNPPLPLAGEGRGEAGRQLRNLPLPPAGEGRGEGSGRLKSATSSSADPGIVCHVHAPAPPGRKPKLLDRLHQALRSRHYSRLTEQAYCHWVKRFIYFHNIRHPAEMAEPEINAFLTHLAVKGKVSASTQNQALSALLFLYRHVLDRQIGDLGEVIRARRPKRLPVVMSREEVRAVLKNLSGDKWLMGNLMYGAGLRLMECLRLRVQDIDFAANQVTVRDGKGNKDRVTMLPQSAKQPLQEHLRRVREIHGRDLADGFGRVAMPTPCPGSIRVQPLSGDGSSSSRRSIVGQTGARASRGDNMWTSRSSRRQLSGPSIGPA